MGAGKGDGGRRALARLAGISRFSCNWPYRYRSTIDLSAHHSLAMHSDTHATERGQQKLPVPRQNVADWHHGAAPRIRGQSGHQRSTGSRPIPTPSVRADHAERRKRQRHSFHGQQRRRDLHHHQYSASCQLVNLNWMFVFY